MRPDREPSGPNGSDWDFIAAVTAMIILSWFASFIFGYLIALYLGL